MLDLIFLVSDKETVVNTIESVKADPAFPVSDIHLLLLDQTGEFNGWLPEGCPADRITYLSAVEKSIPQALNLGLQASTGDALGFVLQGLTYSSHALSKVLSLLKKHSIVSLSPVTTDEKGLEVPYIQYPAPFDPHGNYLADLNLMPRAFHLFFSAFFFRKEVLQGMSFDESLSYDSELKLLLEVLDSNSQYALSDCKLSYTDADENQYFAYEKQFYPEWYTQVMKHFLIDAVKPGASLFRQHYVMYLIKCRYACNLNERDKGVLLPEEIEEFIADTGKALQHIEDTVITTVRLNGKQRTPSFLDLNFLRMKYQDETLLPQIASNGATLVATYHGSRIWNLADSKLEFKVLYYDGKLLTMDGCFPGNAYFAEDEIEIVALLNRSAEIRPRRNHVYSLDKVFNLTARSSYSFQLTLDESQLKDVTDLQFVLRYQGVLYPLSISVVRPEAKLSMNRASYWIFGSRILSLAEDRTSFLIEPLTRKKLKAHEKALYASLRSEKSLERIVKVIALRTAYWLTRSHYARRKIWITQDKLFKAGDNGEYFYRYVSKQKPEGISIYYIVNADSPDYKRLKKEFKTVVKFGSLKHRLLALNCDLMLATHVDTMISNSFAKPVRPYFSDLYNARVVCLAHGLTIQRIAQYQNRVFDNTLLYFFASPYEVSNVSHEVYDYYDKDMLQLTGHARYDGLVNNDQKIILISPTWRRSVTTGVATKGSTYSHSDTFKHTTYYRIYNDLITDEKLIASAKENGYRIIYLLHPAMSSQLEDFTKCDGVEIIAATSNMSYEKILTESSLLVTDYSGIQFDFAYQKKPLVYYHPEELPPQYEAGGLIYDTMGFGPICTRHGEIVDTLCTYMEHSCQMNEMYKDRVDQFFRYSDHNNCARIYEQVMKFQDRFEKVNTHHFIEK